MFFYSQQGALERESWVGIHITLEDILKNQHAQSWWIENCRRFNPAYRAYVESELIPADESAV